MTVKLKAKKRTMTKRTVDQDGDCDDYDYDNDENDNNDNDDSEDNSDHVGTAGRNRDNIFVRQLANGCKCVCSTAKRSTKSVSLSRACSARSNLELPKMDW